MLLSRPTKQKQSEQLSSTVDTFILCYPGLLSYKNLVFCQQLFYPDHNILKTLPLKFKAPH